MADKSWKAFERKIAGVMGGERVPVSGRERGYAPDVRCERWSIECKVREKLPVLLMQAVDQAKKSAKVNQLPVVFLKQKYSKFSDTLVVLKITDFLMLSGGTSGKEEEY